MKSQKSTPGLEWQSGKTVEYLEAVARIEDLIAQAQKGNAGMIAISVSTAKLVILALKK